MQSVQSEKYALSVKSIKSLKSVQSVQSAKSLRPLYNLYNLYILIDNSPFWLLHRNGPFFFKMSKFKLKSYDAVMTILCIN